MQEKQLLEAYVKARQEVELLDNQLEDAKKRMYEAQDNLVKAMEDIGATATAKYDDIGRFQLLKPSLRVSIAEGKEEDAFNYLKLIGEDSLIKQTIHWKSLSSIMSSRLEEGKEIPDSFTYYFQPTVRYEKP